MMGGSRMRAYVGREYIPAGAVGLPLPSVPVRRFRGENMVGGNVFPPYDGISEGDAAGTIPGGAGQYPLPLQSVRIKCSKIIQKAPLDLFSTLWYSVLSTQGK